VAEVRSVLEPIEPDTTTFDAGTMARGEPGVPARFTWRGDVHVVADVLSSRRETTPSAGGSGGYVRRHVVRVRTAAGVVMTLSGARGARHGSTRWILRSLEDPATGAPR
jgi:hypothetical protein